MIRACRSCLLKTIGICHIAFDEAAFDINSLKVSSSFARFLLEIPSDRMTLISSFSGGAHWGVVIAGRAIALAASAGI